MEARRYEFELCGSGPGYTPVNSEILNEEHPEHLRIQQGSGNSGNVDASPRCQLSIAKSIIFTILIFR